MRKILINAILYFTFFSAHAEDFTCGKWTLQTNASDANINIFYKETNIITNSRCSFNITKGGAQFTMSTINSETQTPVSDAFGTGIKVTVTGTSSSADAAGITVTQDFYFYDNLDYFLTEFTISSLSDLAPNYMAPIKTTGNNSTVLSGSDNRILEIPYHNTDFIRFISNSFGGAVSTINHSYEVGGVYNESSRTGLIAGSVEHTVWKTGVDFTTQNNSWVNVMEVYGGRAVQPDRNNEAQTHGSVKGKTVKSPKIFIGYFDDWRDGLELYGDANAIVTPKCEWNGRKPFGWNSWGVIGSSVNFDNATESANWIHDNLQVNGFQSDSTVYIGLDSYWNNMGVNQLLTVPCYAGQNGQKSGIYMGGSITWSTDGTAKPGNCPYTYNDMYLKYNGAIQEFDGGARALDPTHPGVKMIIEDQLNKFLVWGYRYIKLDFMEFAALEADSWYDPTITTGAMAYNYTLNYITDYIKNNPFYPKDGEVFLDLSIAPIFPANYTQGRRISCDVYDGTIVRTQYQLNCLTYGWWLDHAYSYNDGDMVILRGAKTTNGSDITFASTDLNTSRSRVTSAVITGIFLSGDDLSATGNPDAKNYTKTLFTNTEVNELARHCKSFRPVNSGAAGNNYNNAANAADMYTTKIGDITYVALFNFAGSAANKTIDLARIGLQTGSYTVKELWSGVTTTHNTSTWTETLDVRDAKILKIYPDTSSGELPPLPEITKPDPKPDPPIVIPPPTPAISQPYTSAAPAPDWEAIKTTANGLPQIAYGRLIWGDYNNDGYLDAFLFADGNAILYRNNGDDTFTAIPVPGIIPLNRQSSALFLDYNNDGNLDLVTIGLATMGRNILTEDGYILLYKNSGPPDYKFTLDRENTNLIGGRAGNIDSQGRMLQAVDIDHDGWMDLIESADLTDNHPNNGNWRLTAVYKNENGIFHQKRDLVNGNDFAQLAVGSIYVGDVNGDGYADIINVGYGGGYFAKLYINNGDGTFTESSYSSSLAGNQQCETILADVNGDGYDDIIEISSGVANIHISSGNGSSFTKYTNTGLSTKQNTSISVGDVNNDGKLDILVSGGGNPNASIYYNNGTGTSFTRVDLPDGTRTRSGNTCLTDINGDGNLDFSAFGYQDGGTYSGYHSCFVLNKLGNGIAANAAPSVPANFNITFSGGKFQLSWDRSTDDKTPQNAIRYNVFARNNDTGMTYFYAPADTVTGKLKIQDGLIPLISTNSFQWNLPEADSGYTFGLQAVDQANMASKFVVKDYPDQSGNGIKTISSNVPVYSVNKDIIIENRMSPDLNYSVYRSDGRLISSGFCAGGSQKFIPVLAQGIYIVRLFQGDFANAVKVAVF